MLEVRDATEDDWATVRSLRLRTLREDPQAFGSTHAQEVNRPEGLWRERSRRTALAWLDGAAVGTAGCYRDARGVVHVVGMWVAPVARRRGVASALLDHVVRKGRRWWPGAPVELGVVEDGHGARALYERHGFALTGESEPLRSEPTRALLTMRLADPPVQEPPVDLDALASVAGVVAVGLAGSRATGADGPTSDWDLVLWHDDRFSPPGALDGLGLPGEAGGLGSWGPVMQGGAWLDVPTDAGPVRVDLLYRSVARARNEVAAARAGEVTIVRQGNALAGCPTYLLAGEVALARTLRGSLPQDLVLDGYPDALRRAASQRWGREAEGALFWARHHARRADADLVAGHLLVAACAAAHARLAADGVWVFHEKELLVRAGVAAAGPAARSGEVGVVASLAARAQEIR